MRSDQSVPDGVIFVWPLLRRYCRRECGSPGITAGAHSLVGCDQTRASQMSIGEVAHYFQSCWASLGYRYRYAYSNYYLPAVRCSGAVDCCNVLCSGRPLSRRHGLLMDVSRRRVLPSLSLSLDRVHRVACPCWHHLQARRRPRERRGNGARRAVRGGAVVIPNVAAHLLRLR